MRFAQISDIHVPDFEGVIPRDFMGKRLTGAINLLTHRRNAHPLPITERLLEDVIDQKLDHVVVTGDVTNLSLPGEFQRAAKLLRIIGGYDALTVIPGNHDVYTQGAEKQNRFMSYFGDVLFGPLVPEAERRFPAIKVFPGLVIAALSSAVPTPPFMAWGQVADEQLDRMVSALSAPEYDACFKVVLVHHHLHEESSRWKRHSAGLRNANAVIDRCFQVGVDLLLHGHTHLAHKMQIVRSGQTLSIVGSGSSTQNTRDPERVARYNVYSVNGRALRIRTRVYDPETRRFGWLL